MGSHCSQGKCPVGILGLQTDLTTNCSDVCCLGDTWPQQITADQSRAEQSREEQRREEKNREEKSMPRGLQSAPSWPPRKRPSTPTLSSLRVLPSNTGATKTPFEPTLGPNCTFWKSRFPKPWKILELQILIMNDVPLLEYGNHAKTTRMGSPF